jgi:hypothetical protein
MAKADKITNKEYNVHAPVCPFDNKLDYIYGVVAQKATPELEGIRLEIVAQGFDLALLKDSANWAAFETFCLNRGGSPNEIVMRQFLANLSTRPKYARSEGQSLDDFHQTCQTELDTYKFGQRTTSNTVKVSKAEGGYLARAKAGAAALGLSLEEYLGRAEKAIAKRK